MKAITVKYHGPTNRRGARMIASDVDGNRATIDYPHELTMGEERYRAAADQLCGKMGWTGRLIGGAIKGGYVFVWDETAPEMRDAIAMAEATIVRLNRHDSANGTLDVLRNLLKRTA